MQKIPYNLYSRYIKKVHGQRVQKISINADFTCPNRDGTVASGGCTYCNNDSFSHYTRNSSDSLKEQIEDTIKHYQVESSSLNKFFVYFQSYSNTYAPIKELEKLYLEALEHKDVIGLCIGTRSDCVDKEKINFLEQLSKSYDITIEYGLESASDDTLKKINRGHDIHNFLSAIDLTANRGIKMCAHLILGFPWENEQTMLEGANFISKLPIEFVKLHQLHIVKHTVLGSEYLKKPFKTYTQTEYIELLKKFLVILRPDIVMQRLFGSAPEELMLSPHWPEPLTQLNNRLIKEMNIENIWQGKNYIQ